MQPGPDHFYRCAKCDHLLRQESISSGNTFGATIYSDGKYIAPMMPEFADLSKCRSCKHIFWVSKAKVIAEHYPHEVETLSPEWQNAHMLEFLTINEYFRALDQGLATTPEEELYIRKQILWAFNDRVRKGKALFRAKKDPDRWEENLDKLLDLLTPDDVDEKIMIAEIYRNKEDFKKCLELIGSIKQSEYSWIKAPFRRACRNKNREVCQLQVGELFE